MKVAIKRLAPARWRGVIAGCSSRIASLIGLLRGELAHDVLSVLTGRDTGLFPVPGEIDLRCSCPDGAYMCKHIAAALYGVGARLDLRPELFFVLRQVDQAELIGGAMNADVLGSGARASASGKRRLASSAVASVFGIELDEGPAEAARKPERGEKAGAGATVKAKTKTKTKTKPKGKQEAPRAPAKARPISVRREK